MSHIKALVALLTISLSTCFACSPPRTPPAHWNTSYSHHAPAQVNTLTIPVWIDPTFTPEMILVIKSGLDDWNTVLNGHERYELKGVLDEKAAEYVLSQPYSLAFIAETHEETRAGILGWVNTDQLNIVHLVTDQLSVPLAGMKAVVMHEVGHTRGLDHLEVVGNLMYPYYTDQSPCVDRMTVAAVAIHEGWNLANLNWCEP